METPILDQLYLEISQLTEAKTQKELVLQMKYDDLIFAVGNKFPSETRHETALKYIKAAEIHCAGKCGQGKGE